MGKNYRTLLLILPAIILLLLTFVFRKSEDKAVEDIDIKKNNMIIRNFDLSKNLGDKGEYYRIKSDTAKFDRSMGESELDNCSIEYNSSQTKAFFKADDCQFQIDRSITLEGGITGNINDVKINSGEKGRFKYFFEKEFGVFENGVTVVRGNTEIIAGEALIYRKSEKITFGKGVEVNYVY